MLKTTALSALLAFGLGAGGAAFAQEAVDEHAADGGGAAVNEADASHAVAHVTDYDFSFEGPFGSFDQSQLQRGLQVYSEVCAACHGLRYVAYRNLADQGGPAMTDEQMRAFAGMFTVDDPETGESRPAGPPDHFAGSMLETAPDLSLMAKARAGFHGPAGLGINQIMKGMGGPEYITSVLTHFTGEEREEAGAVLYGNSAFAGGWIGMAPPLSDDQVVYADGTPATVDQMAQDVAAFLMWTAEPKMMARKSAGFTAVLFLALLAGLLYYTNKKIWAPHKGEKSTHA
jgi:ubiquinol-cytochrome c reductase cytochrome c1 subunit